MAFARRIAEGDLSARLAPSGQDEVAAMETALNQTAERLGQSFAEIESRRQELAAMLDSMQEAVVAITAEGQVRWSNSVMKRITGTLIYPGRALVHSVRDPDVLACVRGALEKREVRNGRASSLAPGRIFEINAAPLPAGGALVVLHDVTRIEAAEKSRRDFIANVSHELRTPLTSIQGYVETLVEEPRPNAATTREFLGDDLEECHAHEPADRRPAGAGQRGEPGLQAGAAADAGHARWCRMRSIRWAALLWTPG